MAPPKSLLKYDNPDLGNANKAQTSRTVSPRSSPLSSKESAHAKDRNQQILDAIFPPRQWSEGSDAWIQQVSPAASTKDDVIQLEESLDMKLQQRRAKRGGVCPIRSELYSQCFDELIRQETVNCPNRGLLLAHIRDEFQMNLSAHETLFEDSVTFGMREAVMAEQGKAETEKRISDLEEENEDLKKQLAEQRAKYEATEKYATETEQLEEKRHGEDIQALERSIQQLKDQMQEVGTLKE